MTQTEIQERTDAGETLPAGDITLTQPLFVKGNVIGNGTTIHANNFDALIALPTALRYFDPAPYFPAAGNFGDVYRTLGHSCIRFLNTPGDHIRNCDSLTISMRLTRYDNYGSIVGLSGNRFHGESTENFPASPWGLMTDPDWPGSVMLKIKLVSGHYHKLRWYLGNMGVEQLIVIAVRLADGTATLTADGVEIPIQNGTIPPAGSKFADNQTSALFFGAVSNQAVEKGEWGCCDCSIRDASITYNGGAFTPLFSRPDYGFPLIAYNGGFGILSPTGVNDRAAGTLIRDLAFAGQNWGAAITVQSAERTRIENIKILTFATGVQVLGGPLNNYPVDVVNLYGDHQRDTLLRLQRCSMGVMRNIYAAYPRRSVLRADICGMVTVRDVFQAPEGDHTVEDSMRFDSCCHMDLARCNFDYEDGIGPKNSYIRVVGDPCDSAPPPYLGLTHVGGHYKGIDVSGSPWGQPGFPINLINTLLPVSGVGA